MNRRHQFRLPGVALCLSTFTVVTYGIFIYPIKRDVLQGGNVTLECQLNSIEPCVWQLQNGAIINKSQKDYEISNDIENGVCILTISNVNIERDEGDLRCLILNHPDGLVSNYTRIDVIVPPSSLHLTYNGNKLKNNSEVKVLTSANERIRFVCETSHGSPASKIYWQMNENDRYYGDLTNISEAGAKKLKRTTNVLVLHADYKMNAQTLTCIIEHSINTTSNIIVKLNVTYATNNVEIISGYLLSVLEGDDIHFNCEANGNPRPQFEWRFKAVDKNEWQVISNKAIFREIAEKKWEGKYLCLAGNRETRLWSKEMTVKVTDKLIEKFATIPGIFCAVSVVMLFAVILVAVLRERKKKQFLENAKVTHGNRQFVSTICSLPSTSERGKVTGISTNTPNKMNFKHRTKARSSIDSCGYMVARRPLPAIEEIDNDQYVGFDPVNENRPVSSPVIKIEGNLYDEPHIYENSTKRPVTTTC